MSFKILSPRCVVFFFIFFSSRCRRNQSIHYLRVGSYRFSRKGFFGRQILRYSRVVFRLYNMFSMRWGENLLVMRFPNLLMMVVFCFMVALYVFIGWEWDTMGLFCIVLNGVIGRRSRL